jgi:hypothetical protein
MLVEYELASDGTGSFRTWLFWDMALLTPEIAKRGDEKAFLDHGTGPSKGKSYEGIFATRLLIPPFLQLSVGFLFSAFMGSTWKLVGQGMTTQGIHTWKTITIRRAGCLNLEGLDFYRYTLHSGRWKRTFVFLH